MKEFAKEFYSSTAWKECRRAYTKSKGGLCERCLQSGRITPAYIVHHKTPITPANITDPNITLSWDNLMCVCRDCHAQIHEGKEKRYKIDALGRVIA